MELRFEYIWMLALLWSIPAILVWWLALYRRTSRSLDRFVTPLMQAKLRPQSSSLRFLWQAALLAASLFLMLTACARPQWGTRQERVFKRGRDLVIALDVSRSMLANDVRPSRLLRAKIDLLDLIKDLQGDRAALVAFRHKATLICPLTTDHAFLKHALDGVDINSAPRGETDLADAIVKSLDAFDNESSSHKAIILISDGEDLTGKAREAAAKAAERKIPIFTVGLGSARGSRIPEADNKGAFVKHNGEDVLSKLDNDTLNSIAQLTGGVYIPVETTSTANTTLGALYREHLRKISSQDLEESIQTHYVERFQIFLLPAILLALAAVCLSRGRLATAATAPLNPSTINQPPSRSPAMSDMRTTPPPLPTITSMLLFSILLPLSSPGATQTMAAAKTPATPTPAPAPSFTNSRPASLLSRPIPPGRDGARIAQGYYTTGQYRKAAEAYEKAAEGATADSQDEFLFNAAVALFKAGDYEKSVSLLHRIAPRTAEEKTRWNEALASALYRMAETNAASSKASDLAHAVEQLQDSGNSMAESMRLTGNTSEREENLNRILTDLPGLVETAKISRLLEQYQATNAFQITDTLLSSQRQLLEKLNAVMTNSTPGSIRQWEDLSAQEKGLADLWIPLKQKLLTSLPDGTNAAQIAADVNRVVEMTRDRMEQGADKMRNLNPDALNSAELSEEGIYLLWKGVASYQAALQEAMRRQTNSLEMVRDNKIPIRRDITASFEQEETGSLTDLFRKRFEEAVPPEGLSAPPQQSATSTNGAEPEKILTAETRKKILELTDQATNVQKNAASALKATPRQNPVPEQIKSLDLLREIEKLLPKQDQQQQQNDQQKQDQQQDQKNESQQQQQEPKQDQKEKQDEQQQQEQKDQPPEDVSQMLDKAMQREKQHEAEKKKKQQYAPSSPIERDW